jgi:hypothetical protein
MTHYEEAHYFDGPGDYFRRKVHSRIHSTSDLLQYGGCAAEHSMLPGQNFDRRSGLPLGLAELRARRQSSGACGSGQGHKTAAGKGVFKRHRFSWNCQERLNLEVLACPERTVHILCSLPGSLSDFEYDWSNDLMDLKPYVNMVDLKWRPVNNAHQPCPSAKVLC